MAALSGSHQVRSTASKSDMPGNQAVTASQRRRQRPPHTCPVTMKLQRPTQVDKHTTSQPTPAYNSRHSPLSPVSQTGAPTAHCPGDSPSSLLHQRPPQTARPPHTHTHTHHPHPYPVSSLNTALTQPRLHTRHMMTHSVIHVSDDSNPQQCTRNSSNHNIEVTKPAARGSHAAACVWTHRLRSWQPCTAPQP